MLDRHYKTLGVEAGASRDRVKEAYYRAAKKNHPDLFPEEQRHAQALRMMRINKAYLSIVSGDTQPRQSAAVDREVGHSPGALSNLKDPAYTYYKLGFKLYTVGRKTFFDRYKPKDNRFHYMMDNREILLLAISCLKLFEKSYSYFMRVAEDYPDSIWYKDTLTKMHYLERYNAIYQRICASIAAQLK